MTSRMLRSLTARVADRHDLYQKSVQAPEADARWLARYYRKLNGRPARVLREDFCGTAILSCEFVKLHRDNRSIGVDLDAATLEWGLQHNLSRLSPAQRRRVHLIAQNVLDVRSPKADILAAMNFSYWVFKTREGLGSYIENAYRSLNPDGVLFMDAWGGSQAQISMTEKRRFPGFTYVWDQADFDPLTHRILCKIHFEFRDGTRLRNAFVYDWRLWTLPETQELMRDVGFRNVHVLWEATNSKTGRGNGVFRRVRRGVPEKTWIAYVVGAR